ncbi:LacI family DNA-binding transcriptional regulator [Kutzneria sp. CA-103260]|uniref:LacI family DNA-binding transcriptional regulator n=1 Tax=Kutzneria sp. CA-103260 TaxID=2802641 RepID=UPI001BA6629A|nr:LacI family DNA-binding transcriptional regulator [Kutzneria sp. CA-103260]QUQ63736.1 LacI family transcriptional regulator [Kutzneria sp. CA-103260]
MTIYQVAETAGVSISTVSLALNHPDRVSERTRERIIKVAGELGYRPGATPSARAKRRTGRIAVVAPFSSYESYRTRLIGILDTFGPDDVEVVVHDAPSVAAAGSPLLATLPVRGDVDGLVIMGIPLADEGADRLRRWGPPTVLVDSSHPAFTSVTFDDEQAGFLLASHLVDRGHRRIGYLHETQRSPDYVSPGMLRRAGIHRALGETPLEEFDLPESDLSTARSFAADFLSRPRESRPTAVICHHDLLAAGFLSGLRSAGATVPTDVAVTGIDDGPLAEGLDLTTVRQPFAESGRQAAEILRTLIQSPNHAIARTLLAPQLIIRTTT